jgi:hypothetical protein
MPAHTTAPEIAVAQYLQSVERALRSGDATEHTYRPFLIVLLDALAPDTLATNEPKRSAAGAPDFVVTTLKFDLSIGYIEAKDVGLSLDDALATEQLARYRRSLPNLLLTDYLEFRWFVGGEKKPRLAASLARIAPSGKLEPDAEGQSAFVALYREFAARTPEGISTPEPLAARMAALAHLVRDLIVDSFRTEQASPLLRDWHRAFSETLLPDLSEADFADMFAQTLAYGLFSARIMSGGASKGFDRAAAQKHIPRTNPFLRDFFYLITGPQLDDEPFAGFVADIVQTLSLTNVYDLLENFGRRGTRDPMLHFYETFLAAYDPKLRELRGVYYTPEPVVGWLVRSVDALLKSHFDLPGGLEDSSRGAAGQHRVLVLDPATGTATFLYAVICFVRQRFIDRNDAGQWSGYVHRDLLPRLFGFELLMAPYAVAHFKLGLELAARDLGELWRDQWAYEFAEKERLNIYLTNTLDDAGRKMPQLLGPAAAISAEAQAASSVKHDLPVLVVMGNPPYSNFGGLNKGEWILGLLDDYKRGLNEKKLNLDDDFIKFIRWAQWRIAQTGSGIVAYITNNVYLDGLTHRRMREALLEAFDEIHIVNLHGSSKKQETTPDGSKDDNVFDITVGVSLALFVKLPPGSKKAKKGKLASLRHADLWGTRKHKYAWLDAHDITNTQWTKLKPAKPNFWFVPKDESALAEYETYPSLREIMPTSSNGIKTERDGIGIHFSPEGITRTVADFRTLREDQLRQRYELGDDSRDWSITRAKADVLAHRSPQLFQRILYRPFDIRHTWYSGVSKGFIGTPGAAIMRHMVSGPNFGLLICRQQISPNFNHIFCTNQIAECCVVSNRTKEITSIVPLYLYPEVKKPDELIVEEGESLKPNLAPQFIEEFSAKLKLKFVSLGCGDRKKIFGPEDVLYYAYAIFHAPGYRTRYAEFLCIDFPRLPLTANQKLFRQLCGFGKDLVDLHLLKTTGSLHVGFPDKGSNEVAEVTYTPPHDSEPGRVRINNEQWFENVPPEVWAFRIGSYQVCEKWLKDRRSRQLTSEERQTYPRIIAALAETLRLQAEIDTAIKDAGGWPLE